MQFSTFFSTAVAQPDHVLMPAPAKHSQTHGSDAYTRQAHESTEVTYTHELTYAAHSAQPICLSHMQGICARRACNVRVPMDTIGATCTVDANMLGKSHDHLSTYRTHALLVQLHDR